MSESSAYASVVARGGTRYRRSALLFLPAMVGVLLLTLGTLFGVLPLNLYLSGQDFVLTSNGDVLVADGLTLHGGQVQMKFDGQQFPVSLATIDKAELAHGLCISLTLKFPVVGTWTVRIQTDGDTVAKNVTLGSISLSARSATLQGTVQNPVSLGPSVRGGDGLFGIGTGRATLTDVRMSGKSAVIKGTVNLRGIAIPRIHRGTKGSC